MNLKELMREVHNVVYSIKGMVELTKRAQAGDLKSKQKCLECIKKLITEGKLKNYSKDKIDDLIKQYHVNYYEPIYDGRLENLRKIVSEWVIKEDDPIERKIDRLAQIIYQENYGLSVIDELADYSSVINEVGCNGAHYVWIQIQGIKEYLPKLKFESEDHLQQVIQKAISFGAKSDLNETNPEVLCQRADGSRITALCPPYSGYYQLNIRKFNINFRSKEELIKNGTSSEEFETFIDNIAPGRPNIIIIGDQGTGKTTYLLRYIDSIPDYLALATIETMFELEADKVYGDRKNIVKLQVIRNKDMEQAFATCLRLGRDIIITGEIREPIEALVTLKSMLRQGRGSCGTFHSTSPRDFIYDYRNLLLQSNYYTSEKIAELDVARAIDLVIHLKLNRITGQRYIGEVCEVLYDNKSGNYEVVTIFKYDREKKKVVPVRRISDTLIEKMREYEITDENIRKINEIFSEVS